jgi:uncharacterized protein (DUF342 family)
MWHLIPFLKQPKRGRGRQKARAWDQQLSISVSADGLQAVAYAVPEIPIDPAVIRLNLEAAGIRSGIHEDALRQLAAGHAPAASVIASGQAAVAPRPMTWLPLVTPPAAGSEPLSCPGCRGLVAVQAGQPIARRQPAEDGQQGWTVHGETVAPPEPDLEARLELGDGCLISPRDPDLVLARHSGTARLEGNRLTVAAMTVVAAEAIARQTIHFEGPVLIKGHLTPGTRLSATGDIHVWGNVEGAAIETDGDLVIHGGVVGQGSAQLIVQGSISAQFIDSAEVEAGENVLVVDQLLRSQVTALDSVVVCGGPYAQIAGGTVRAGRSLKAAVIGSRGETRTVVEVGTEPAAQRQLWELQRRKQEAADTLESLSRALMKVKLHGVAAIGPDQIRQLERAREDLLGQMADCETHITRLARRMRHTHDCQVEITHRIFGGAKLRIGDHFSHIDGETAGVNFRVANGQLYRHAS